MASPTTAASAHGHGENDDPRLAGWERRTRWLIILAAVLPLMGALSGSGTIRSGQIAIDASAWVIFAVDFVVHLRWRRRFLRTWQGWVDLGIVVVTFPWYLVPFLRGSDLTAIARLARVARIAVLAFKGGVITLAARLGKTAVFAVSLVLACAVVVQRAEPAGTGFDSFGDSVWWAIVTVTTVGYGDLVPQTTPGRVAATILMIGGLAVLGTLAAIMSSFVRGEEVEAHASEDEERDERRELDLHEIAERIDHIDRTLERLLAAREERPGPSTAP